MPFVALQVPFVISKLGGGVGSVGKGGGGVGGESQMNGRFNQTNGVDVFLLWA